MTERVLRQLGMFMRDRLSDQEIQDICFYYFFELFEEINVDAWTKRKRVREFLARVVERNKLPNLIHALQELHGDLLAEEFPEGITVTEITPTRLPLVEVPPVFDRIEWVEIPAGEFWMGDDKGKDGEKPCHRLHLDTFWIAKTPVTNAQWQTFVQATGHEKPKHWVQGQIPNGKEQHPVVYVNWHDAREYCLWLEAQIDRAVNLPSEAEWEKAARGSQDKRRYPWGDEFDKDKCNTRESGIRDTTPVGNYPAGASPYGVLDMSGNVWEWTRSLIKSYPYDPKDGREDLAADGRRGLRGGSWFFTQDIARAALRGSYDPNDRSLNFNCGFRVLVLRPPSSP